jgi:predicted O-methyltransferase YrrM
MTPHLEHEAGLARERAAHVEGWLSEAQGRALFEAAAATTGRGAIVEIGSWKGRSTTWLASGARLAGQRVYAVDPVLSHGSIDGRRAPDGP